MQRNILGEVPLKDMQVLLSQLNENLSDPKMGYYWRGQLRKLLRKEPTHVLTVEWLETLSGSRIWTEAEEHHKRTGKLWFNNLEWPFQICVLEVGMLDKTSLKLSLESNKTIVRIEKHIEDISLMNIEEEQKKIRLIRIQGRMLGFRTECKLHEINCSHPDFNLNLCSVDTAFWLARLPLFYDDKEITYVAMKFHPNNAHLDKQRLYYFSRTAGYGIYTVFGAYDLVSDCKKDPDIWWIFEHKLIDEKK